MHLLRSRARKRGPAARVLVFAATLAVALAVSIGPAVYAAPSSPAPSETASKEAGEASGLTAEAQDELPTEVANLVALVNAERKSASVPLLHLDSDLCKVATSHAEDMIRSGYFGHVSPDGVTLAARLREAGLTARKSAENLAGHTSVDKAHEMLMGSPSHRGNILNDEFSKIGIAVVRGGPYGLMIVEVLASDR